MVIGGIYHDERLERTTLAKCSCGRYVRRIRTDERASHIVPKESSGHHQKIVTHTFVMVPATDMLCEQCYKYGHPEVTRLAVTEKSYTAGGKCKKALDKINVEGNYGSKTST